VYFSVKSWFLKYISMPFSIFCEKMDLWNCVHTRFACDSSFYTHINISCPVEVSPVFAAIGLMKHPYKTSEYEFMEPCVYAEKTCFVNFCFISYIITHSGSLYCTEGRWDIQENYFLWPVSFVSYRCCRNEGVCRPLRLYALHGKGLDRQWRKTFLI